MIGGWKTHHSLSMWCMIYYCMAKLSRRNDVLVSGDLSRQSRFLNKFPLDVGLSCIAPPSIRGRKRVCRRRFVLLNLTRQFFRHQGCLIEFLKFNLQINHTGISGRQDFFRRSIACLLQSVHGSGEIFHPTSALQSYMPLPSEVIMTMKLDRNVSRIDFILRTRYFMAKGDASQPCRPV